MASITESASRSGSDTRPAAEAPTTIPWTRLPLDLVLEVSGHLHHADDFVRLHAVCKPWRDAAAPLARPTCLPWVLASCDGLLVHSMVDFRCSFDTPAFRRSHGDFVLAEPPEAAAEPANARKWIASADATAAWLFVGCPGPRLVDLVTGAVTRLPPFPDDDEMINRFMRNPHGIVYGDGTIFLYGIEGPVFAAAILRPHDARWTTTRTKTLDLSPLDDVAYYHNGHVLVCAGTQLLCAPAPNWDASSAAMLERRYNLDDDEDDANHSRVCSYILESGGDVLWASVLLRHQAFATRYPESNVLSVSVHMLREEEEPDGSGESKMRWVRRDGRTLADRALFLGSPASFAVKLNEGGGGGCAYFVFEGGVFRYSFVDAQTKLMKWLRPGLCPHKGCMWLRPKLSFTSTSS